MTVQVPGDPAILEPLDKLADASKRSTVIFLHGLGDDGHGTGYGLAQQFQRCKRHPAYFTDPHLSCFAMFQNAIL